MVLCHTRHIICCTYCAVFILLKDAVLQIRRGNRDNLGKTYVVTHH